MLELGPAVNRVVFMGIGEPLHNYDQVLAAIRILRDRRGRGLRTSGITISTIGIPKRLRQLREEHLKTVLGGDLFQRVADGKLSSFKHRLERGGVDVVVRDTQCKDIDAARGQLWLREFGPGR